MAEKKVLVFTCDRCGMEHRRLRGKTLPSGWVHVLSKDLCPKCTKGLTDYLDNNTEPETTVIAETHDGSPLVVSVVP